MQFKNILRLKLYFKKKRKKKHYDSNIKLIINDYYNLKKKSNNFNLFLSHLLLKIKEVHRSKAKERENIIDRPQGATITKLS